jgi:phosphoribosylaminoimidazole-succinocarboxamide synthase
VSPPQNDALLVSDCPGLRLLARGKVRDVYEVDEHSLLFVATDRISAFDVVMKNGIPGKGRILTHISLYWFEALAHLGPNHLLTANIDEMPARVRTYADQLAGRSMLVRRLHIVPVEAIVRGYLSGSGWKEYQTSNTVCGIALPPGLLESTKLEQPLFTPSTKAAIGGHDENISPQQAAALLGDSTASEIARRAIALYSAASEIAAPKGLIIADTKFEFGRDRDGALVLADEALTPDSSRFWPAVSYAPGRAQPSFDKQFLRDYLESIHFDKTNPVELPPDVIANTRAKYVEACKVLTGTTPP